MKLNTGFRDEARIKPLFVYVAFFFAIWSLRATVLYQIDQSLQSGLARWLYSQAVKIVIWTIPVFLYLKLRGCRKPLSLLKLNTPVRGFRLAAALIAGWLAGMLLFARFAEGKHLVLPNGSEVLIALLGAAVSPFSEELLFRGFILNSLCERLHFRLANLITAVLFVLIHWPYYLWSEGFTLRLVSLSAGIFIIGLFLGWLMKLTDSLWPGVVAHTGNNFLVSFLRN